MSENLPKPTRAEKLAQRKVEVSEKKALQKKYVELLVDYVSKYDANTPQNLWSQQQQTDRQACLDLHYQICEGTDISVPYDLLDDKQKKFGKRLFYIVLPLTALIWGTYIKNSFDPEFHTPALGCQTQLIDKGYSKITCLRNGYRTSDFVFKDLSDTFDKAENISISQDNKLVTFQVPSSTNIDKSTKDLESKIHNSND